MATNGLLIRIIGKGGTLGECANMCLHNEEKGKEFIRMCYEHRNNEVVKDLFGDFLISDIEKHIAHEAVETTCSKFFLVMC
jgi:hypothetical protein